MLSMRGFRLSVNTVNMHAIFISMSVGAINESGFPENYESAYFEDDINWDQVENRDDTENTIISLLKEYLKYGKYSANLKSYAAIFAGLFGHHPQVLHQREIMNVFLF